MVQFLLAVDSPALLGGWEAVLLGGRAPPCPGEGLLASSIGHELRAGGADYNAIIFFRVDAVRHGRVRFFLTGAASF